MVLNIAHRGARSLAPENTLPAIKKAWEIGADVVEIDVAVTADSKLILLHDTNLKRTTDILNIFPNRINNPCTTFTLAEISSLDAGSWFLTTDPFGQIAVGALSDYELQSYKGIRIPRLDEVLSFVKEKSWRINLEIKKVPPPMEDFSITNAILQCIEDTQINPNQLIISSFEHKYIRQIRDKQPDIEINALIGPNIIGRQDWGDFTFSIYNADAGYTDEEQIRAAHKHGCMVNLYTVNRPDEMQRFIQAGARGLFTDFPQILAKLKHQIEKRPDLPSPNSRTD
jgi:glycerophosphoryl diester phosphodiesterase